MRKTILFISITLSVSWLAALIAYLSGLKINTTAYVLFAAFYMFFPGVIGFLIQKYWNKEPIKKALFISFRLNKWFLVALFTPVLLSLCSVGVSLLLPGVSFAANGEGFLSRGLDMSPEQMDAFREKMNQFPPFVIFLILLVQALIAGCSVNALAAFGEELGWRGYMLRHLSHWTFFKICVFTGFVWGIWHFPLILMGHNYPDHPIVGVLFMTVFCILLSPMMTYLVIKSGSVISASVFHGSLNAIASIHIFYLSGGSSLSNGLLGYTGFIVIALFTLVFYLYDKYISKENIFSGIVKPFLD